MKEESNANTLPITGTFDFLSKRVTSSIKWYTVDESTISEKPVIKCFGKIRYQTIKKFFVFFLLVIFLLFL